MERIGNEMPAKANKPFKLPTAAWAEARDITGERLRTLGARLEEGAIVVDIPPFAKGARGTVTLRIEGDIERTLTHEVDELPHERMRWVVQLTDVADAQGATAAV